MIRTALETEGFHDVILFLMLPNMQVVFMAHSEMQLSFGALKEIKHLSNGSSNGEEALRTIARDLDEGADMIGLNQECLTWTFVGEQRICLELQHLLTKFQESIRCFKRQ